MQEPSGRHARRVAIVCLRLAALLAGACAGDPSTGTPRALTALPGPTIAGCPALPADDEWNRRVDGDAIDPRSDQYLASMRAGTRRLHADFGGGGAYGIPWTTVDATQPTVPMSFEYDGDSDPGPYPLPSDAPIEGGASSDGDRHVLVVDRDGCKLYETWDSHYVGPGWHAGSGAIFDLRTGAPRPAGWTSADAAGLPILPGLVRRDEVLAGHIDHALRFTTRHTQAGYVFPARHFASSSTDPARPPLGIRLRLKAGFDTSGFGPAAQVVLTALKQYGMLLADNGSDWFLTGEANPDWDEQIITELDRVPGSAFEVVQHGPIQR